MAPKSPDETGRRHWQNGDYFWRVFSVALPILVIVAVVAAASVLLIRRQPSIFFTVAEYMPRKMSDPIPDSPDQDEEFFKYGGIGNEANEGLPYRIWAVLPKVCPQLLKTKPPADKPWLAYRQFGFLFEDGHQAPIGMSRVNLGLGGLGVEQIAINCSVCHVQTYRPPGGDASSRQVFVGGVANQLDSQAYVRFISDCTATMDVEAKLLVAMKEQFKQNWLERRLYSTVLIPMTLAGVEDRIRRRFAWTWANPIWGPGRVDPFNPPKFTYLKQPIDGTIGNSDMMPPWNGKRKEEFRKTSGREHILWHWDGLSADLTEVIVNSALGDGMTRQGYEKRTIERLRRYLDGTNAQGQNLPGLVSPSAAQAAGLQIDETLKNQGKATFEQRCAECHGWDGKRFLTIIESNDIATDDNRLKMWTAQATSAYNNYDEGRPWKLDLFKKFDGYLAQPLEGIWLTGPYLHNGSVPTLTDLLKPQAERPKTFVRGSDELDFENGGYRSPTCDPSSYNGAHFCYDTQFEGNRNTGHSGSKYGTDMSPEERRALVHYLLTL
ncbi:MAG: hypothetical protein ACR2OV_15615 [Hyphomicrobiaceae bacterium]